MLAIDLTDGILTGCFHDFKHLLAATVSPEYKGYLGAGVGKYQSLLQGKPPPNRPN